MMKRRLLALSQSQLTASFKNTSAVSFQAASKHFMNTIFDPNKLFFQQQQCHATNHTPLCLILLLFGSSSLNLLLVSRTREQVWMPFRFLLALMSSTFEKQSRPNTTNPIISRTFHPVLFSSTRTRPRLTREMM